MNELQEKLLRCFEASLSGNLLTAMERVDALTEGEKGILQIELLKLGNLVNNMTATAPCDDKELD